MAEDSPIDTPLLRQRRLPANKKLVLEEEDDTQDALSWIKKVKPPQKTLVSKRTQPPRASYSEADLSGLKVVHDISDFSEGSDAVLVLKDSSVLNMDEGDELISTQVEAQKKLEKVLREKEKSKLNYSLEAIDAAGGSDDSGYSRILSKYDEESAAEKPASFYLGKTPEPKEEKKVALDTEGLNLDSHSPAASDFYAPNELNLRPKKKRKLSLKQLQMDFDPFNSFDLKRNYVDDEDLQSSLMKSRLATLKNKRPAFASNQNLKVSTEASSLEMQFSLDSGNTLVLTETSEFINSISANMAAVPTEPSNMEISTEHKISEATRESNQDDHKIREPLVLEPVSFLKEPNLTRGVGAALKVLQSRGEISAKLGESNNQKEQKKWVIEPEKLDKAKQKLLKLEEKDLNYKPQINISRKDEFGRELTPKEAYKHLSHKFHGNLPGKAKTEKRLQKINQELKMSQSSSTVTQKPSVIALQSLQKEKGKSYLLLGVGNKNALPDPSKLE